MNIIPLIEKLSNDFNKEFGTNFDYLQYEETIKNIGDEFTIELYVRYLEYIDTQFMNSLERKEKYYVKEKIKKSLLTKIGLITFTYRIYIDKETNERFALLRELLNIKPYQRISDEAEYELVKYAMSENLSEASRRAIRNTPVSRSTLSKKLKNYKGSTHINIIKSKYIPEVLYIEMDEVHANLQDGTNHICPCAIVHEGHKEEYTDRKVLKNVKNFATTKSYDEMWEVIYYHVDQKYDIDEIKYIFVSGDGAPGIKAFAKVFPYAVYVLDPYHYKGKALRYLFKNDKELIDLADQYLRNDNIDEFKSLVQIQIEKYPDQKKGMLEKEKYLINNIDGIKNQHHEKYKCSCSMEGHVSQAYARYITSSPYGFSLEGLENKLKLLVMNADKHELSFEEFLNLKYGEDEIYEINKRIKKLTNIKRDVRLTHDSKSPKVNDISVPLPKFDNPSTQDYVDNLIRDRKI